ELITDGVHGLLVPSGNTAALTRAFRLTLGDPAAAASRAAAARNRVEQELSFTARLAAVEAIYAELLDVPLAGRVSGIVEV
ncbi:MAG: glycosyltransferase, partial [Vicinamibacterales bacterium]